jgi:hypothetical protein
MGVDPKTWLELWVGKHLGAPVFAEGKAAMRDAAKACVADGLDAGLSIMQIKEAAGGDLEAYLVIKQHEDIEDGIQPSQK